MEVNIHHAKTNLSQLIVRAEAGEEIVIARAGKPAVRLVPVSETLRILYKPGALKGRLTVPDDFVEPDPEIEALFLDSSFPDGLSVGSGARSRTDEKVLEATRESEPEDTVTSKL